jgi:hypothetical protein
MPTFARPGTFAPNRAARTRTWLIAVASLASVASRDVRADPSFDSADALAPVAGSRLVPIFIVAEDESRQFFGWFDKARNENCSFAIAADGVVRCLPSHAIEARLFSDSSCKQRVAAMSSCAGDGGAPYIVERVPSSCSLPARLHVHEVGARLTPAAVFAEDSAGACERVPVDRKMMYVAVGAEINPAAFVAAKYAIGRRELLLKTEYEPSRP